MKKILSRLKPYLRWVILGGTLFFLAKALKDNWREVAAIRIEPAGWAALTLALGVTLLAHIWSGWVWGWILQTFKQPVSNVWAVMVYLKTNIAKYLPGNVWHFYGRIKAVTGLGASLGVATLSVLLEPLLMAAAALLIALIGSQQLNWGLQLLALVAVLGGIHPRVLNPILDYLKRVKGKVSQSTRSETADPSLTEVPPEKAQEASYQLKRYPLLPLLGEVGFVGLRGVGFVLTFLPFVNLSADQVPSIMSAFSLAWLLGLVIPGAPGGIGVFEATALALLDGQFSSAILLSAVALYRLISVLAEAAGAGLVWLDERR
ncbi:MAG: UPF0104 family protein [Desertifilum sp. SIO1I2]|nr:UPF0104 family protein [Desertifilum sp. SIO1I2]